MWHESNRELFTNNSDSFYSFLVDFIVSSDNIDLLDNELEIIEPQDCLNFNNNKRYKKNNYFSTTNIDTNPFSSPSPINPNQQTQTLTKSEKEKALINGDETGLMPLSLGEGIRSNKIKIRYYLNTFDCFFKESKNGTLELDKIDITNNHLLDIFYLNKNKNKIKKELKQKIKSLEQKYSEHISQVENLIELF